MDILDLDIETYSTVNIKKANVYAYVEDPDFEVMMCGWSLNGSPIEVWDGEGDISKIPGLWDPDVKKVAHNAGFERVCFSRMAGLPVGEYLPPEDWFDTAAVAALMGLPRSLEALAKAIGLTPKDTNGGRLINLFCQPHKGRRVMPSQKPVEYQEFKDYCGQDVGTMQEARLKMGGWPADGFERDLWYVDQRINDRGWTIDTDLALAAVEAAHANAAKDGDEVVRLTGIDNPNSTQQLGEWCADMGFPMPNWQKETVADALTRSDLPDEVRTVLELRQELALVAHRKFEAAARSVSQDGRLRGQFKYHAAHTGRWSSQGVQVHNLPKLGFSKKDPETGEKVYDEEAEAAAIVALDLGLGAEPETLKKLVRPMFIAPKPDEVQAISDFSAIEARCLAWEAGEEWVLEAFRQERDLYVETAERMGGGMGRPEGKIAVLAGGYQGAVGSLRNMGYGGRRCPFDMKVKPNADEFEGEFSLGRLADLAIEHGDDLFNFETAKAYLAKAEEKKHSPEMIAAAMAGHVAEKRRDPGHKCDPEVRVVVDAYREANPNIVSFWSELQHKFWTGGVVGNGLIRVEKEGSARLIRLPSGRGLIYRQVAKRDMKSTDKETGEVTVSPNQLSYRHIQGYIEKTYGGRLTENVTQAVARDLLADAMIRLDKAGYRIVGHVHDEVIVETRDLEGVNAIMKVAPAWAEGMPMDAAGFTTYRYKKD